MSGSPGIIIIIITIIIITNVMISLRRTLSPTTEDRRRTENSLKMCVFEVKGLPDKKKYFCEIHVDDKIYARYASTCYLF